MNLDRLVPLDEASLSRIQQHWQRNGFASLTTWRDERTNAENRRLLTELKARVKQARFGWIQVVGAWAPPGETPSYEPSLIIPSVRRGRDHADTRALAEDSKVLRKLSIMWGRDYGQWGVLWVSPEGQGQLIATSPRLTGKPLGAVVDRFEAFKAGDTSADIRTVLSRASHRRVATGRPPVGAHVGAAGRTFALESVLVERAPVLPTEAAVRRAMGEIVTAP